MSPAAPVHAVIFDWGGTLTPWHEVDLREQWLVYARTHIGQATTPDTPDGDAVCTLADAILEAEGAAWQSGREQHTSASIERILTSVGIDHGDPRSQGALAAYRQFWEPHTHTDPQVRPLWQQLRESGLAIGVLSNTIWSRDYHRAIFERDGVLDLIDADTYSSEIEWVKPHPEAFRAACDAVGVAPEHAVYVGDRLFEDVHGPQQIGMRAIWIPHSDIPASQIVQTAAEPDATARQLLDIAGIVAEWNAGGGAGGGAARA